MNRHLRRDVAGLVAALVVPVAFLLFNARRTFDFFDMSGFLDAGYRVYRGQRLYVDFWYNAGPVHPALHALFFHVFGFGQTAVLSYLTVTLVAFGVASYYLARSGFGKVAPGLTAPAASLLTALALLAFAGPISHPFYDLTAFMFVTVGLALYQWHLRKDTASSATVAGLGAGALAALGFMTKANEGAAGAVSLIVLFALGPAPRRAVTSCLLGGLATGMAILATLHSPGEFIHAAFIGYRVGDRFANLPRLGLTFVQCLYFPVAVVGVGIAALGGWRFMREHRHEVALLLLLSAISIFSAWTGSIQLPAYTLGAGLCLVYVWRMVRALDARQPRRVVRTAVTLASLISVVVTVYVADRSIRLDTWRWRNVVDGTDSPVHSDYAFTNRAFAGWRCDRIVGEGVDAAVRFLEDHARPEDRLFVFPDATFIYGLLGRESWISAPFIFHLNQGPPPGDGIVRLRTTLLSRPPEWIVLHEQWQIWFYSASRLTAWLGLERLFQQYDVVSSKNTVAVLRFKGATPGRPRGSPPRSAVNQASPRLIEAFQISSRQ